MDSGPGTKILTPEEAVRRYRRPRSFRLVFTNGCFDLLHAGHVTCLHQARRCGDALLVAINSDRSVRAQGKGVGRPVVGEDARALVVAALEAVDAVCVFDDDTPGALIRSILPDVLVKGGDYTADQVVGRAAVEAAGGRVELVPLLEGHSTSRLLKKIRAP